MTSNSSLGRFVAWCGSFVVTMVVFRALAERRPPSTAWIVLSLVVASIIGAAVFPTIERLFNSSRAALARIAHRCSGAGSNS